MIGAFLNVNGLQSKAQALQAWLEGAQHLPDLLGFVETNKEEGEAPTQMASYTRVAVSGSGRRRNRGAELYIHKEYHHRAEAKYTAPRGTRYWWKYRRPGRATRSCWRTPPM